MRSLRRYIRTRLDAVWISDQTDTLAWSAGSAADFLSVQACDCENAVFAVSRFSTCSEYHDRNVSATRKQHQGRTTSFKACHAASNPQV